MRLRALEIAVVKACEKSLHRRSQRLLEKNVANAKAAVKAILTFQNFIKPHNIPLNQKQEILGNATTCL